MNTTVDAGLYMRLSVEDETNNESTSIQTQRAMLTDYCREKGFRIVDCYVDDGETGTNFERPEFQRMLRDIEAGKINTVICKDLSRFGRNYYEAGMYLDKYFVERKIRFIKLSFEGWQYTINTLIPFHHQILISRSIQDFDNLEFIYPK